MTHTEYFLKTFEGGSDCLTVLMRDGKKNKFIRKTVPAQNAEKLKAQVQWLRKHSHFKEIPKVLRFFEDGELCNLDIEYLPSQGTLAELMMQTKSAKKAALMLDRIIQWSQKIGTKNSKAGSSAKFFPRYLQDKVILKVKEAFSEVPQHRDLSKKTKVKINGRDYVNLVPCARSLQKTEFWKNPKFHCLEKEIHGDLTLENILVHQDRLYVLDPNGDNLVSDLSVEWGKLFQSLHSQYELFEKIKICEKNKGALKIAFPDNAAYRRQFVRMKKNLVRQWGPHFLALVYLHEAIHFVRLLPYKARRNPELFLAYYGRAVVLLNEASAKIESLKE